MEEQQGKDYEEDEAEERQAEPHWTHSGEVVGRPGYQPELLLLGLRLVGRAVVVVLVTFVPVQRRAAQREDPLQHFAGGNGHVGGGGSLVEGGRRDFRE